MDTQAAAEGHLIEKIYDSLYRDPRKWSGVTDAVYEALDKVNARLVFVIRDEGVDIVSAQTDILESMNVDCMNNKEWEALKLSAPDMLFFDVSTLDELEPRKSSYSYIDGDNFFSAVFRPKPLSISNDDLHLAKVALAYLNKALRLYLRLFRERLLAGAALTASDHFALGTIFINQQARVVGINEAARSLVSKSHLVLENNRLSASDYNDSRNLSELIDKAIFRESEKALPENGFIRMSQEKKSALQLMVVPYNNTENAERVYRCSIACIVFINDPNDKIPPLLYAVSKLYDLTPKQTNVCEGLLAHKTLPQIAQELHISVDGAKYHLREIFIKTGVNRQSELMSFILSSVAGLRA